MTNPLRSRAINAAAPVVPRTNRGWKQDMVDHMNDTMNPGARDRGLQWRIGPDGNVFLGFNSDATRRNLRADMDRQEAERRDWKRKRHERDMEHRPFADGAR